MASEQDAAERAAWWEQIAEADPADFLVLDETSTPLTLTPRRARAPRGERAIGQVPRGRWEAVPLLATVTVEGPGPALQFPGALDRDVFDTFVADALVPALRPGQVVIWDNLSVHKSAHARQLIEAAGCQVLPLPCSSPACNPIELVFAKLKEALRRAAARTFDAIVAATGATLATVIAAELRAYFTAAGYDLTGHHF